MTRYDGKNSKWLIICFLFYNILPILLIYKNIYTLLSSGWWILFWAIYFSFNLLWIPILINNKIELYDNFFIFYYGFGKEKVMINDIVNIHKSRNPIASSANSLDRIHIITQKKDFYVSLKNNDGFIQEIKKRKV